MRIKNKWCIIIWLKSYSLHTICAEKSIQFPFILKPTLSPLSPHSLSSRGVGGGRNWIQVNLVKNLEYMIIWRVSRFNSIIWHNNSELFDSSPEMWGRGIYDLLVTGEKEPSGFMQMTGYILQLFLEIWMTWLVQGHSVGDAH